MYPFIHLSILFYLTTRPLQTVLTYSQGKYQEKYPANRLQEWRAVVGNYGIPNDYHLEPIKYLSDGLKTR
jgi:hypothetical protein